MPIHCGFDEVVGVESLVPNPRNPNKHPDSQIELLAKIIAGVRDGDGPKPGTGQGWRAPITVSRSSGYIVRGHGRYAAAIVAGLDEVPVEYQLYDSEASEYADLIADNRISELSAIDDHELKDLLREIDSMDFDVELAGFDDFALSKLKLDDDQDEDGEDPEFPEYGGDLETTHKCPKCGYEWS